MMDWREKQQTAFMEKCGKVVQTSPKLQKIYLNNTWQEQYAQCKIVCSRGIIVDRYCLRRPHECSALRMLRTSFAVFGVFAFAPCNLQHDANNIEAIMYLGLPLLHFWLNYITKKVKHMKKFMTPEVEIIKFSVQDIINASGDDDLSGGGFIGPNCIS